MKEYTYTKSRWRLVFLAAAVVAGVSVLEKITSMALTYLITRSAVQMMGIIGGADGPTSIYIASPGDGLSVEAKLLISLIVLAAGIFGYYRFSRMKKK